MFEMSKISIIDAFNNKPDEAFSWDFSKGSTFLQTDSERDGQVRWYLTHAEDGDPARSMQLESTLKSVAGALVHYAGKSWMQDPAVKAQLLDALMPALRALAYE